ncbi:MAG: TetR/AcrR family transcriptional regulator [Candidatus Cloacimonetes bacterium]|nr:TetR/AcrR family transcriptional regulator [Candidatus Cloacimonadota bacterium]
MEMTKRQMDIVNAAINIIAQKGMCDLTTKNLAREVKVTEAALYRHFTGKAELIDTILAYFKQISDEVIGNLKQMNVSPLQKIRRFVFDRYGLFESQPELARVMFSEDLFGNDPGLISKVRDIMHSHRDEVILNITEAQKNGLIRSDLDALQVFRIIIGSMRLLITQWNLSSRAFSLTSEGEKLWNTIEKMIKESK